MKFETSIVCLISLLLTGCTRSADAPEVILERARIHAERDEYVESIPLYSEAIAVFPERAEIYYLRGVAYENSNLPDRALDDYARCIELDPSYPEAINNYGVVLAKLKRYDEAVEQFSRLINLKPDDALALRNRGLCFHDLGESQKSIDDYTRAIEIAPGDAQTWFQRANVHLDADDYATAEVDFSKAIEADQQFAKAWMNRGIARMRLGRRDEALLDFSKGQELDENIIVPGMDFLEESTIAGSDTSWNSFLSVAEAKLAESGYTNLRPLTTNSSLRFVVYTASLNDTSVQILATGLVQDGTDPQSREILVPQEFLDVPVVESEMPHTRTVMILQESLTDESSWIVLDTISDWQPEEKTIRPHIVRIEI